MLIIITFMQSYSLDIYTPKHFGSYNSSGALYLKVEANNVGKIWTYTDNFPPLTNSCLGFQLKCEGMKNERYQVTVSNAS